MHRPNEALGDLQTARQKRPAWIAIYRAYSAREPHRSSSRDMSDLCGDATVTERSYTATIGAASVATPPTADGTWLVDALNCRTGQYASPREALGVGCLSIKPPIPHLISWQQNDVSPVQNMTR
ncbi:hypothetical protein CI102_7923 [Trichoderma harzianum]|uniref:Uncharacterized protein n=1 Tax=Trichoderma harzianum CBS 226.95 TaxID=983964 RepID=A0A2T4AIG7_TRIHA|nr:hypothetical protein M431DRAFT_3827 [Trichoderma harzianum CBS 226.95]PKK46977.1 hypothetical protein CI102_7923 [Trichoderma harzianum]PTB56698.1 hypothetical protein M431DRAFT_3827 [Trichoderma harzianum CBS 226.95]